MHEWRMHEWCMHEWRMQECGAAGAPSRLFANCCVHTSVPLAPSIRLVPPSAPRAERCVRRRHAPPFAATPRHILLPRA